MLSSLKIQNYALIRELEVDLSSGFSIITGETGAGKSILLGALGLILGQRADSSVLKDKGSQCVVEASFSIDGLGLEELFLANDLDYDHNTIFRREINPAGKSRAFINDTPVMLKVMQEIGCRLVDIHSQNQNLELNDQSFQLMVLDIYAGNQEQLKQYKSLFNEYRRVAVALQEAKLAFEKSKADLDYYLFQFDQLEKASLVEHEQTEHEKELAVLTHAEEIKLGLSTVEEILNRDEGSAVSQAKMALGLISKMTSYLPEATGLADRLQTLYIDLKDIAQEVSWIVEKVELDPTKVSYLNERLDLIYTLQQKHHVDSVTELIAIRNGFALKIEAVSSNEEEILLLTKERDQKYQQVIDQASLLRSKRFSVSEELEKNVVRQLTLLGMPNSRFKIEILPVDEPSVRGLDSVSFLFTANKNGLLCEISKVVSGGEMSRLMLVIKALISASKALPTIVFDEIDAGVSGDIAERMGLILKDISKDMQVINITHLPQIAAKGDHHFRVFKQDSAHETTTSLKRLTSSERVEELAKMLSGESITAAAILNAEELLKS